MGSQFRVNTYQDSNQTDPAITVLPSEAFLITYSSYGFDGNGYGVAGQFFNPDGSLFGNEFQVSGTLGLYNHGLATLNNGKNTNDVFSVFEGSDTDGRGIFGQPFFGVGTSGAGEFQINGGETGNQVNPEVSVLSPDADDSSYLVIVYEEQECAGGCSNIVEYIYRKPNLNSGSLFNQHVENRYIREWSGNLYYYNPTVLGLSDNSYAVAFEQYDSSTNLMNLMVMRCSAYQSDGGPGCRPKGYGSTWPNYFPNHSSTLSGSQENIKLAELSNNQIVAVYNSRTTQNDDGDGAGIFARKWSFPTYNSSTGGGKSNSTENLGNSSAVGEEFQVNTATTGEQSYPDVSALEGGGYVVVWRGQDNSGQGIYAKIFTE